MQLFAGGAQKAMLRQFLKFICGALVCGLVLLAPHQVPAQDMRGQIETVIKDYITAHPEVIGAAVRAYFAQHPEALGQIMATALKQPSAANATDEVPPTDDRSAVVASNAGELFSSPHQVTLGNPRGNVTLVEFFDYNCGFCKRALPDMLGLLKDDPNLRIVLKEFPILGPGSAEAARVAIAVRMQDTGGEKYLAFHQELLGESGPASKEKALEAAKAQGLDMARLEKDMSSNEVDATLAEDMKLASAVGITGTPGYVVGNKVVVGAVGIDGLKGQIEAARSQTAK